MNPIDAGDAKGQVDVHYDLAARHLDLAHHVDRRRTARPVVADYAYNETHDGGGDMVFNVDGDVGGTAATENVTIRSRWLADGDGPRRLPHRRW